MMNAINTKGMIVLPRRQGFLLFELLVVFALVSIIATLAFAHIRILTSGYVRAEIEMLYQTCLYAQRRAMSSGRSCVVSLDFENRSYSCNGCAYSLAKGVCFGFRPGVKGPPSAPGQTILKASTFQNNQISCSPDGIIDAGTIYLTDTDRRSMYAVTSGVAPYSYLRTYRYDEKWQRLG